MSGNDLRHPEHWDPQLAEGLRKTYSWISIPDGEAAWMQMQARLRMNPAKTRRRIVFVSAAAVVCVLLFLAVARLEPAQAAISNVINKIIKHKNGFTTVTTQNAKPPDTSKAKTAPPPDIIEEPTFHREIIDPAHPPNEGAVVIPDERILSTIDEARAKLAFPLLVPAGLPEGFVLKEVRLQPERDGKSEMVWIEYRRSENESIHITEQYLPPDRQFAKSSTFFDKDTVVKDLKVNGVHGLMVISGTNRINMDWRVGDNDISIYAVMTEDEALKLAQSMK